MSYRPLKGVANASCSVSKCVRSDVRFQKIAHAGLACRMRCFHEIELGLGSGDSLERTGRPQKTMVCPTPRLLVEDNYVYSAVSAAAFFCVVRAGAVVGGVTRYRQPAFIDTEVINHEVQHGEAARGR